MKRKMGYSSPRSQCGQSNRCRRMFVKDDEGFREPETWRKRRRFLCWRLSCSPPCSANWLERFLLVKVWPQNRCVKLLGRSATSNLVNGKLLYRRREFPWSFFDDPKVPPRFTTNQLPRRPSASASLNHCCVSQKLHQSFLLIHCQQSLHQTKSKRNGQITVYTADRCLFVLVSVLVHSSTTTCTATKKCHRNASVPFWTTKR
jgi:hypothetical protein